MPITVGNKFGSRTVTKCLKNGQFDVVCDCGAKATIKKSGLFSARHASNLGIGGKCNKCRTRKWETRLQNVFTKYKKMIGKQFGEWTVIGLKHVDREPRLRFELECSCGNIGITSVYHILRGRSRSCARCKKGVREWRAPKVVLVVDKMKNKQKTTAK
mgnify:CR=1 FL=1